jgi:alpha-L-fucosidase 2
MITTGKTREEDSILWYDKPADKWLQSLPAGNGRIGVTVFGSVPAERLSLSESTVWSGRPCPENDNPKGPCLLPGIQKTLLPPRADEDIIHRLMDAFQGKMENYGTSRPFGEMILSFDGLPPFPKGYTHYKRSLNMRTGILSVAFSVGDTSYERELYVSNSSGIMVMKIFSNRPGQVGFQGILRPVDHHGGSGLMSADGTDLVYQGQVCDGPMRIHARMRVLHKGGELRIDKDGIRLRRSDEAIIYFDMATTFREADPKTLCRTRIANASAKTPDRLREEHIKDFSFHFDRVSLWLGSLDDTENLPSDRRLSAFREKNTDLLLDRLMFQYARYLTLSAARKDSPLPMHLQGIWNDNLAANMCWTCDYHLDINAQMNQWMATPGNLPEGNLSMGRYLKEILVPSGRRTAKIQYGKKGWVAHTMVNAWGYSSVIHQIWSVFPTAGAWMAATLWDQYDYYRDLIFLEETAYPILKEAALFFLDYLIEYPDTGHFVTAPSCSPEHGRISVMPTSDRVILTGLFESVILSSEILGLDEDLATRCKSVLTRLPPLAISPHGQLKEWYEDHEETDGKTGHRHMSHLLALFPYEQITAEETPELMEAAKKSIDRRIQTQEWEKTEFAQANLACFYARMKNGNSAYEMLSAIFSCLTAPNLMTVSPKGIAGASSDIFIVDGNMGIGAAMAEMLLQSHRNRLELLPALPDHWDCGQVKGLQARGNFTVDLIWSNFTIREAIIRSGSGGPCTLVINRGIQNGKVRIQRMGSKEPVHLTVIEDQFCQFNTLSGVSYRLTLL